MNWLMINSSNTCPSGEPHVNNHVEFVRLWTAAAPRVHAYIVALVLNWADAEDLLQDVGVTAWEKFEEFDPGRDFVAWACGIARNKVLSYRQKSHHRLVQSEELVERIEQVTQSEPYSLEVQREALHRCLDRLTEAQRRLLVLHETPGISLKSVARESGQSIQALYKSVQRIRVRLFDCVTRRLSEGRDA